MARIIEPTTCKTVADLQRAVMEREPRVAEHEVRFNEQIPESVQVAALRRMLTPKGRIPTPDFGPGSVSASGKARAVRARDSTDGLRRVR